MLRAVKGSLGHSSKIDIENWKTLEVSRRLIAIRYRLIVPAICALPHG
jgi:hypothetical protein